MKHLFSSTFVCLCLIAGCTTTQQTAAFNSISSLENTVVAAYDGYCAMVAKGVVATNGLPAVSKAYNKFQGGALIALDAVQYNTNALAPAALQQEANDVTSLIHQFTNP
jgi:hypothetical protein